MKHSLFIRKKGKVVENIGSQKMRRQNWPVKMDFDGFLYTKPIRSNGPTHEFLESMMKFLKLGACKNVRPNRFFYSYITEVNH